MSRTEQPPYRVEQADGAIELRSYPALTVATVTVGGTRRAAIEDGFRVLAGYIFGANARGQKIAMTAPVMQSRGEQARKGDAWTVRFIMPRALATDTLPKPNEARIALETLPPTRYAVLRFSGWWRDALLQDKTAELRASMHRAGWEEGGAPIYAFYNPPWTLPIFRRNEVMIPVRAR